MRWTTETVIAKLKETHGDKFDLSKVSYINSTTKIELKCNNCGKIFQALFHNYRDDGGCKDCVYKSLPQNQPCKLEDFIEKCKGKHGNKYLYIKGYKNSKSTVTFYCTLCSQNFSHRASSHLNGTSCPNCVSIRIGKSQRHSIEEFESECVASHENRYKYFQDYSGLRKKIRIQCNTCNFIFHQEANAHQKHLQGCPQCNFSKGELVIASWLKEKAIKYEIQKTFDGCKDKIRLKFDFYLPDYNVCIEYDGQQHFNSIEYFGGEKRFLDSQKKDSIKDNYCLENNIKLIRIHYKDYKNIKIILNTEIMEKNICLDQNQVLMLSTVN